MRLSHYDGLDFLDAAVAADVAAAASQKSDVPTLDSINELRRKLRESMRLNALLTAERERNARTLQKLQHLVLGGNQIKTEGDDNTGTSTAPVPPTSATDASKEKHGPSPFAFLQQKGSLSAADRSAPLGTTTAFTLSQLQALRALSESLRNVTPDLSAPTPPDDDDDDEDNNDDPEAERKPTGILDEEKYRNKSWRRQRTEYVEHATRRHLEIVHGLELGRHGEVRDGEWQGEGRQLAHGEVEGLERVAAMLGKEAEEMAAPGAGAAQAPTATGGQQQEQQQQPEELAASSEQRPAPPASFSASTTRRAGSATAATTPAAKSSRVTKSTATTPATASRAAAAAAAAAAVSAPSSSHKKIPAPSVRASALRRTPPGSATKVAAPAAVDDDDEDAGEDLMDMS